MSTKRVKQPTKYSIRLLPFQVRGVIISFIRNFLSLTIGSNGHLHPYPFPREVSTFYERFSFSSSVYSRKELVRLFYGYYGEDRFRKIFTFFRSINVIFYFKNDDTNTRIVIDIFSRIPLQTSSLKLDFKFVDQSTREIIVKKTSPDRVFKWLKKIVVTGPTNTGLRYIHENNSRIPFLKDFIIGNISYKDLNEFNFYLTKVELELFVLTNLIRKVGFSTRELRKFTENLFSIKTLKFLELFEELTNINVNGMGKMINARNISVFGVSETAFSEGDEFNLQDVPNTIIQNMIQSTKFSTNLKSLTLHSLSYFQICQILNEKKNLRVFGIDQVRFTDYKRNEQLLEDHFNLRSIILERPYFGRIDDGDDNGMLTLPNNRICVGEYDRILSIQAAIVNIVQKMQRLEQYRGIFSKEIAKVINEHQYVTNLNIATFSFLEMFQKEQAETGEVLPDTTLPGQPPMNQKNWDEGSETLIMKELAKNKNLITLSIFYLDVSSEFNYNNLAEVENIKSLRYLFVMYPNEKREFRRPYFGFGPPYSLFLFLRRMKNLKCFGLTVSDPRRAILIGEDLRRFLEFFRKTSVKEVYLIEDYSQLLCLPNNQANYYRIAEH